MWASGRKCLILRGLAISGHNNYCATGKAYAYADQQVAQVDALQEWAGLAGLNWAKL
jgi:hypothetical protein